ncbi:Rieske (2Fe-2S) protein [Acidihalobacter prosperus]
MSYEHYVITLQDLPEPGSTTVEITVRDRKHSIILVRHAAQIYGYLNQCPHRGTPLDWMPGNVLDKDRRYIICATHGALFRIHDGHCIAGPCLGEGLIPIPLKVDGGTVYIDQESGAFKNQKVNE